jgi:hypothetical protein
MEAELYDASGPAETDFSGERTRLACYASPARTDGALAIANFTG